MQQTQSLETFLACIGDDKSVLEHGIEAARQGAVLPILTRLGWDVENVREVVPQFGSGTVRADYCLRTGEKDSVVIGVKSLDDSLAEHQEQLLNCACNQGVELAILTNGLVWWFYVALCEGSPDQRRFVTVDVREDGTDAAAGKLRCFLGRDAVASGSAVEQAHTAYRRNEEVRRIGQAIPVAWRQLCEEPDELLLELLAEKTESLCGYRPDEPLVAEFVAGTLSPPQTTLPPEDRTPLQTGTSGELAQPAYTGSRPTAYTFQGRRFRVKTFKEVLVGLCRSLSEIHDSDFRRVLDLRGHKRRYFSTDPRQLRSPARIPGKNIFAETHLSAEDIVARCHQLLKLFRHPHSDLSVEIQDGQT